VISALRRVLLACCLFLLFLAGCRPSAVARAEPSLTYLGQARIGHGATFEGTVIGGLSAISYDAGRQCYYVISDDRSAKNPARFYTLRLSLSDNGISDVTFTGTHPLRDESGRAFAPLALDASPMVVPPDPEGIAFDPARQRLYWSSEGERLTGARPVSADPWIRIAGLDGGYLGRFTLPPGLSMSSAGNAGPRRNKALEGLTLTPDGAFVFAAMEQPGYNDGDPPGRAHGALTRITKFDVDTAAPVAQYAYPLEPATAPADSNGATDLVALSDTTFLVIERAEGSPPAVRVFRAEIGAATDVLAVSSLVDRPVVPMTKTLAADLSATAGRGPRIRPLDNIEGVTLGPRLPDGRQAVVFVSDDNFSAGQVTQFLLFAM
jgi:hypothetical protein